LNVIYHSYRKGTNISKKFFLYWNSVIMKPFIYKGVPSWGIHCHRYTNKANLNVICPTIYAMVDPQGIHRNYPTYISYRYKSNIFRSQMFHFNMSNISECTRNSLCIFCKVNLWTTGISNLEPDETTKHTSPCPYESQWHVHVFILFIN
jgi:hypothetical protein